MYLTMEALWYDRPPFTNVKTVRDMHIAVAGSDRNWRASNADFQEYCDRIAGRRNDLGFVVSKPGTAWHGAGGYA